MIIQSQLVFYKSVLENQFFKFARYIFFRRMPHRGIIPPTLLMYFRICLWMAVSSSFDRIRMTICRRHTIRTLYLNKLIMRRNYVCCSYIGTSEVRCIVNVPILNIGTYLVYVTIDIIYSTVQFSTKHNVSIETYICWWEHTRRDA